MINLTQINYFFKEDGEKLTKKNDDFFSAKKKWSVVKDGLLKCYLEPYVAKILHARDPLVYVDCFAGKGKFNDGNIGSPLIALNIFKNRLQESGIHQSNQRVEANFIELNHSKELMKNIKGYSGVQNLNVCVRSGNYEEEIQKILKGKSFANVFLYLDPYGVKNLDFNFLSSLSKQRFHSIELLINFNSHGFLRVACKFLKKDIPNEIDWDYLTEYDNSFNISSDKSEEMLNRVAGGDYWKKMVLNYYSANSNFYDLEENLTQEYCLRLRKHYAYVLNMPIRVKENQSPKYRMIHATNHPDGAVLMADNIFKREELMRDIQSGGQQNLFETDFKNKDLNDILWEYLSNIKKFYRLNRIMAEFFTCYGVQCNSGDFANIIKILENEDKIEIVRTPSKTKTGRQSKFCKEGNGQTVELKWKN